MFSPLVLCLLFAPRADIDADTEPVPVDVEAASTTVSDSGEFVLRLTCTPREDFSRRYELRVALTAGTDDVLVDDHELLPKTTRWRSGRTVDCEIPLALPPGADLEPGEQVSVRIGFVEDGRRQARPPAGLWAEFADDDGLSDVLAVEVPVFAGTSGAERLEQVFDQAQALQRSKNAPGAWAVLEEGLRKAADDRTKERLRDALIEVGRFPPAPQTAVEKLIVKQRIRDEKVRYFRLIAGRMYGRGELHGALRLLEKTGGSLAEAVDEKVIGAVGDADRVTRRIDDIRKRILTDLTPEEEARVAELVEKHGRTKKLLKVADALADQERFPLALALYRKLRRVDGIELYDRAQIRLEEVGELYLAATPPDQAEQVTQAIEHPAWARTRVVASQRFLFIGPERLVEGILPDSKLYFDLAYVYLTDLFGRKPNPGGDRVTVYFKELWEFGGGVGGGKIINIGKAQAEPPRAVRVDTGLLYHELTHCVDDTLPIHAGFREGLANLGAAFVHEALAREGDSLHSFDGNLRAFQEYFLDRDLEYWRIQNYGPSAGFFLHFVDTYAKRKGGKHDWAPLRRFFREYRDAPVRDGREPHVMRGMGLTLARCFGPRAFDDLMSFGFPLAESDRYVLTLEDDAYAFDELDDFDRSFGEFPTSPLPRDLVERELVDASRRSDLEACADLRVELGVVFDWKVIGPFFAKRSDPGAHVFAPELEIDFGTKPRTWRASRVDMTQRFWQDPLPSWVPTGSHKNVTLYPSGWLHFDFQPYGDDDSAIYALTHVTVSEAQEALAHVRADDDFVLFVGDRRIGSYRGRGSNGSTIRWRGPFERVPDGMRFPVRLEAGRNKVLVKVRNRSGTAGLSLAFSRPDGSTLSFTTDGLAPDPVGPRPSVAEPIWKRLVTLDSRSFRSKSKIAVGSFRARGKAFAGTGTDGRVAWRLFTVRPGFPKDSPSNLLWLKPNLTRDVDALRIVIELESGAAPKMVVTFQGEGGNDGLSGWNLILVPSGTDKLSARLERYDRLVYQSDPVELPEAPDGRVLVLAYWDGWCSASIDGVVLLDRVSVHPIPGRHRVGLATWGSEPLIRSFEVARGRLR